MKVAFASCSSIMSRYQSKQPIWGVIRKQQPDLLLLLGDNVYIGNPPLPGETSSLYGLNPAIVDPTLEFKKILLRSKYEAQVNEPHFNKLLAGVDYLPIWDNHDFGLPADKYGADVSKGHRKMARKLFNQYLKDDSVVPNSKHVYCSYTREDENGEKIKFFMLDVRSRQENASDNPDATLLGEKQENWLLQKLESSKAAINIICSGIPYTYWEKYTRWLNAFNLVAAKKPKLLFLGGQVHHNEFNEYLLVASSGEISPIRVKIDRHHPGLPPQAIHASIKKTIMYEAVSSGVGQNAGGDPRDEGMEADPDDSLQVNEDYGNTFAGLPLNNYGIIDFTGEKVRIMLYSQIPDMNFYAEINRDTWILEKNWNMGNNSQ